MIGVGVLKINLRQKLQQTCLELHKVKDINIISKVSTKLEAIHLEQLSIFLFKLKITQGPARVQPQPSGSRQFGSIVVRSLLYATDDSKSCRRMRRGSD